MTTPNLPAFSDFEHASFTLTTASLLVAIGELTVPQLVLEGPPGTFDTTYTNHTLHVKQIGGGLRIGGMEIFGGEDMPDVASDLLENANVEIRDGHVYVDGQEVDPLTGQPTSNPANVTVRRRAFLLLPRTQPPVDVTVDTISGRTAMNAAHLKSLSMTAQSGRIVLHNLEVDDKVVATAQSGFISVMGGKALRWTLGSMSDIVTFTGAQGPALITDRNGTRRI